MSARGVVLRALRRVSENGYSSIVIDNELKKSSLDDRDKRFASNLFYGVLENEQQLDHIIRSMLTNKKTKLEKDVRIILRMGFYQLCFMDKVPDNAAVDEAVRLAKKCGMQRAAGMINAMLRNFLRSGKEISLPDRKKDEKLWLSIKYSCPMWLIENWINDYGVQCCENILSCLAGRPPIYARVNNTKTDTASLIASLTADGVQAHKVEWLENAVSISCTGSIEELKAYKLGWMHIQDLSSQLCSAILDAHEGETVLDVCAAPGGKSFTIAERMNNSGSVLSCDIYSKRVAMIAGGAHRLGLSSVKAMERDALNGECIMADRVLCDVPCSGLGIIRRKPDVKNKNAQVLAQLPEIQYDILCRSSESVKAGGVLVYSTCTLCRGENSAVVERFLAQHDDFEAYPFELPQPITHCLPDDAEHMLTLMPFIANTDGFFIARMKRKG